MALNFAALPTLYPIARSSVIFGAHSKVPKLWSNGKTKALRLLLRGRLRLTDVRERGRDVLFTYCSASASQCVQVAPPVSGLWA